MLLYSISTTKEIATVINNVLQSIIIGDQLPLSLIEVNVIALESDGGLRSSAINAAVLACIDAGIPIRGFVTAVTVGFRDDTILLGI